MSDGRVGAVAGLGILFGMLEALRSISSTTEELFLMEEF